MAKVSAFENKQSIYLATHEEGGWFRVQLEKRRYGAYVLRLSGAGAGTLFRPVWRKIEELARERRWKKITADVVPDPKLLRLARLAGFKRARLRSFLGMPQDRGMKGLNAIPMYKKY